MSGILRNSMRAAVIALICAGAMSVARAQEEWKTLSGEALQILGTPHLITVRIKCRVPRI